MNWPALFFLLLYIAGTVLAFRSYTRYRLGRKVWLNPRYSALLTVWSFLMIFVVLLAWAGA